jgi:hypothetical protein
LRPDAFQSQTPRSSWTKSAIRNAKRKRDIKAVQRTRKKPPKIGAGRKTPATNDGGRKDGTSDGCKKGEKKLGANINTIDRADDVARR